LISAEVVRLEVPVSGVYSLASIQCGAIGFAGRNNDIKFYCYIRGTVDTGVTTAGKAGDLPRGQIAPQRVVVDRN
jgi:hypothetical protein